jgi:ubiquinone/menaquinone biosynthesis C-methylase UbiE
VLDRAEIDRYWDDKAVKLRTDPSATMKDVILRSLEIEAIYERMRPDDDLLDVGTGNAYGALQWARRCNRVVATDFSARMIESAEEAIASSGLTNIRAERADVLDLSQYANQFSAVSCVRCLINLTTEQDQIQGLQQLLSTVRVGGRLFLIEGFTETFQQMNLSRETAGLTSIPLNWHNRLLSQNVLENALPKNFAIAETVDFGEYYFLSRIVHPLLVAPEEPEFDGELNVVASRIWRTGIARGAFKQLSTLMLYVLQRSE